MRGSSVLASPYVAGYEREREAAARAYRRLLRVTMAGEGEHGQDRVELVGRLAGFGGEVRGGGRGSLLGSDCGCCMRVGHTCGARASRKPFTIKNCRM